MIIGAMLVDGLCYYVFLG